MTKHPAAVLAGDVGGTNSRLALFGPDGGKPLELEVYPSAEHGSLVEIVEDFTSRHGAELRGATVGVAGPVRHGRTEAVNLAWPVDARELAGTLACPSERVAVINDLEANAWGIAALGGDDLAALADPPPQPGGNVALISAGTGLGEAFISFGSGGEQVHASEGGHVDFAPRTPLQAELREWLGRGGRHVSYERVCSGTGMPEVYEFLRRRASEPEPEWLAKARSEHGAAAITRAGLERRDAVANETLDMAVSVYGAQAGNLALTVMATGGVYLGGGIAPNILPRLRGGEFMRAFLDKGRLSEVVERMPVHVILNELTALLGAARHAERRARGG